MHLSPQKLKVLWTKWLDMLILFHRNCIGRRWEFQKRNINKVTGTKNRFDDTSCFVAEQTNKESFGENNQFTGVSAPACKISKINMHTFEPCVSSCEFFRENNDKVSIMISLKFPFSLISLALLSQVRAFLFKLGQMCRINILGQTINTRAVRKVRGQSWWILIHVNMNKMYKTVNFV